MDTTIPPAATAGTPPTGESKVQEQARLRRERRAAKIMGGGSDRLNKITSLAGRPAPATEEPALSSASKAQTLPARPSAPTPSRALNAHADDPDEVDITSMFQRPPTDPSAQSQQDLFRQMLAASGPPPQMPGFPDNGMGMGGDGQEDPMLRMMQQLMGGMGGMGNGAGPGGAGGLGGGLPPGLAEMFGGQQQPEPATNTTFIWRIVHAAFALSLGIYAATSFTFTGSQAARVAFAGVAAPKLFWIFSTIELLLQSSRYFMDGGKLPISGILGGLSRFLPEPYANYIRIFSRYSVIYTSIVADAMVVVFVLGAVAWWRGLAAS